MLIGIDNGLDGGIVALSPIAGLPPVAMIPMPTKTVRYRPRKSVRKDTGREVREIDTRGLAAALESLGGNRDEITVYFEDCPFHADRAMTMRSMGVSAGKIVAVLEAKNFRHVRIFSYEWHPAVLGKVPQGKTKAFALAKARELWPDQSWLASKRSITPHMGLIDAALIAEYGRRLEHEVPPVTEEVPT